MNHLTDDQLSAQLDGRASANDAATTGRHLAECDACRARLAELSALDASLARALDHDPGDAYFASFAERVAGRIAADAAPSPAPSPGRAAGSGWWNSPRSLAWAGGALTLLAVAALAIVLSRGRGVREFAEKSAPSKAVGAAEGEPMASAPLPQSRVETDHLDRARQRAAAAGRQTNMLDSKASKLRGTETAAPKEVARGLTPQHMQELQTLPNGEQVAVGRNDVPARPAPAAGDIGGFRKPGAQPAAEYSYVAPPAAASPRANEKRLGGVVPLPAPAVPALAAPSRDVRGGAQPPREEAADAAVPSFRICGEVHDPRGRPLVGAAITIVETGFTTMAGANGTFCVDAPAPSVTVSVLAVGYRPWRATLKVEDADKPLAVALLPVDALAGATGALAKRSDELPAQALNLGVRETGRSAADEVRLVYAANTATADAGRLRTAAAWDRAAGAWAKVAELPGTETVVNGMRYRVADARMHAWRLGGADQRRRASLDAIGAFLKSASRGAQRDSARAWRGELAR